MDSAKQIELFHEFLDMHYLKNILENYSKGIKSVIIDFADISRFNPELANLIIEDPEEILKAAKLALEQFDIGQELKLFEIRLKNIPESQRIAIRDIRSNHIGKLIHIEGIVRQKSDVRPQVTSARFECPSCGSIIPVLQFGQKFREPNKCSCGRSGKFRLLSKELMDVQKIVVEESPEDLEGGEQPKRISAILSRDLVSPMSDKKTNPGSKIIVIGVVKEIPITLREGGQSVRFDLIIETNNIEPVIEDYTTIEISPEDLENIKLLSKDPYVFKKLVNSLAPTIYGHEKVKEAIVLQLMGGCKKIYGDGARKRGDIHILLIGDPGAGKSVLLRRVSSLAPKGRFVSGKGASGAGLTAAVVRDEFLRGWALEAGALVLSNNGFAMIDELDKMSSEDRSAMHEALEQQTVTISKANIQATLRAETTVLAAANPKFGRFDPYEVIAKQIDLPPTLINRFDLIFPIKDLPDTEKDEKLATFVLNLHSKGGTEETEIPPILFKKYVAYARTQVYPQITEEAMDEMKEYYVKMRGSGKGEGNVRTIPISPRQLEALVRLAEASARVRLSDVVTRGDARVAIELVHYCLTQIGWDPETQTIDIDRITTGIPASQRSNIHIVKDVIIELENKFGKAIKQEDIINECELRGIGADKVEEILEKLRKSGDIFSPKHGIISRI